MKKHYHQRHLPGPVSYRNFEKRVPGLKKGVGNSMFWSEIGLGFGEPRGTPPPKIPRSTPSPPGHKSRSCLGRNFTLRLHKFALGSSAAGFLQLLLLPAVLVELA